MYHYRKLKCLLLLMLVATTARAQLEDGKVYYFVNIENAGKSMTARTSGNYLTIATTDESDYSQLWYADEVETDVYTLRNLGNGKYLRSPNANDNAEWICVKEIEDNAKLTWAEVNGNDVLRASNTTNGSHYLHYGASTGTIVCWSTTAASQWTFTEVSVDAEVLADNWEVLESIDPSDADLTKFQTALNNLFTDKSCTELAKTFESVSDIEADTDYLNLPTVLQEMVKKVYNEGSDENSWAEDNGDKDDWDASYAKKYRVQLYEPYNEPEAAATALGINAHTNLNNPTGIYADTREALYVMVGGTIKEGASLYLAAYTGNGRLGWYGNGVELHEGLNVIPSFVDGNNYCINYVVHTFDTSDGKRGHKAKARKLSDYDDLKIHIEGGHINGYYNKMGDELYTADKNADWDYIEARATQTTVTILGEYITLQFPLNDATDNGGNSNKGMSYYLNDRVNVEDVINEWDKVMIWERLVLGLLSEDVMAAEDKISPYSEKNVFEYTGNDADFPAGYDDYYNVHGLSLGVDHNYMYGSWEYCGYHYNTMGGVIETLPTNAGSHWGPGHEIGHQHQALLTVNGLTEVTNNLFSNVVLWYFGETTSRYNGDNGSLTNVLTQYNAEGTDFFSNNIWAQTHMYYKLFLYYHVLGHNTKFYPRLFEMLRQDPMSGGYYQSGATSILHFYKKCCLAAGEDLTEFFRAYGFFEVMENRLVGDYSSSEYTQSQEDIDAAIAEVKTLAEQNNWNENIAVLFINDGTGETILSHKGDTLEFYGESAICAEVGSYASFTEEAASADYTCELSGNTVTMSGTDGVGFAIFNEEGELIGFSDKKTFEISSECAVLIMSGEATIAAMTADNEPVEVEYDEASVKSNLLGGLLEDVSALLALSDSENKKPGFYKTSALEALQAAYDDAQIVYDSRVSASYSTAYETLYREYIAVQALTTDKVPFLAGSTYVLTNKLHSGKSMAINDQDTLYCVTTNLEDTKQQWTFESADAEDTYYLKNVSNSKYLRTLTKSGRCDALAADTDSACPYKLFDLGDGLWALQCQNDVEDKMSLHCDGSSRTVGWWHTNSDNTGSWWYLTATTLVETDLPRYELEDLITKTETLIDEVGYANNIQLQAIQPDSAFYLYCNALFNKSAGNNNGDNSMNTAKLLDGDPTTFIHTDYRTSSSEYVSDDALDHYLRVDMGEGNTVTNLQFTYTTRNAGDAQAHPKTIVVAGCNDLETEEFTTIVTLPQEGEDALPGANTNNDGSGVYTSPEIANDTPYRYIRFMVTETQGTGKSYGNHPYFYMAEFGLLMKDVTVDAQYADDITVAYLTEVFESLLSAQNVLATATTNEELKTAYSALEEKYNALLTKRNTVNNAAINTKKDELLTLIGETNTLIESCVTTMDYIAGTYNGTPKLQTTDSIANFYLWTNAQEADEGPIANLVDGSNTTYFHSDYSGANSTDQLDHHVTVNLGESNKASSFAFKYVTRHNTDANYPATIKIWGSEDGETFEEIESVTNLPKGQTLTYGPDTIDADKYYSYLRFMVTANDNGNSKGGHPIFHMAEFSLNIIGTPESYTIELGDNAGDAGEDILIVTHAEMTAAQAVYDYATTENQVEAAISKLTAAKEALATAQQSNNKAPLRDLIAQTTELINECATVNYVDAPITTTVELKATETEGYAYLSCPNLYNPNNVTTNDNTDGDIDYNCEQLLDNEVTTYIHTNYNAATDTYPHYLQVAFGTSEVPAQFKFSYTTRSQGDGQVPKHIRVEGSNDGMTFGNILGEYDFEDATNPLPTTAGASWTADEYLTSGYSYLRFYVTESPQTNPYFSMSEFSMETYTPAGYDIDWNEEQRGNVTEEQLIAACEEINAANDVLRTSSVQSDIEAAQALLQEKYNVLYAAKNSLVKFTVQVEGGNANGGVTYNEVNYVADATFDALPNLTAESLTAIALDGYVAKSITITDRVVTVTYNKVYTVQVTGGGGNGGVTFGEQDYADGDTFDAVQASFTAEDLTTIVPDGYTLKEVTVDHETGVISVSYAAIPLVDTTKYYTLACKAADHATYIRDLGTSINGRSAEGSLFLFEAADEDNGYYIKSYVSEKYLNCTANDNEENDAVVESEEKLTVWKMAKPSHTDGVVTLTAGYDKYLNNNGDAPTYLLARYHSGGPGESNACSLWTLTEGEPLDMSDLATLIEETNTLIASCYTDGVLNYVNSAYVTEESLTAVREVVADAQAKHDSKATVASEYTAAMTALQEAKDNLTLNINLANTEATERNNQRGLLNELISDTEELITLCGTTPGDATQTLIDEVSVAVTSARTVADNTGSTVDELTDATTALQAKYDVLSAAQQSTAKDELLALIEQTNTLIEECGTVTYGVQVDKTPITLQTTDENADGYLFCNAPYLDDATSGDYSPASEGYDILDNDYETFLHTDWDSDSAPNEDHYLRVSLGSIELSQFVLMYSTRGGGGDVYPGNPKRVVVEGCATADGEYTEIAVLTSEDEGNPLPQGSALSHYTSAVLDGTGYKFIRFRVTENQINSQVNSHCWFYISEFSLASAVQTEGWNVTFNNGVGRVTEAQLIAIYQKNDEATELANTSYDKTALDAAKAELQSLYDALAFAKLFPVELTTDAAAPVLYTIKTKREGDPVLQYETENGMFSVVTAETGKATQAFYFMRGDENQVYIYPYMAGGKVLAANDVANGDSKALAMEKNTATYEQWIFVGQAEGYYNLQPANTSTYLSNIYGTSHKMGFYSSEPDTDKGSLFKFEPTTMEGSYAYLVLKDYYETQVKVASSEIQGGSAVGYYPTEQATAYNTAYAAATEVLASADNTDEAYQTAYSDLVAANDALEINMPEEGKFYRLRSVARGTEEASEYAYVNSGDNKMYHSASRGADDATTIWAFTETGDGTYKLTNLHTGTSLANNGWENYKPLPLYDEAEDIEIVSLSGDGQVGIWCGDIMLHADGNGKVVRWVADANSGSAWRIVEVEDMPKVKFSLTVGQYLHAGLYLNYPVTIPDGVKAYIIDGTDIKIDANGVGTLKLTKLQGSVLPAGNGYILDAPTGDYDFYYTEDEATDEVSGNMLGGSPYLTYREAVAGHNYYVFGQKSGVVGLYNNAVKYDATGTEVAEGVTATHYKVSANKVLFDFDNTSPQVSSFRFRIDDEATDIENVGVTEDMLIYDLCGRRIMEVKTSGLYIINGEKRYVEVK